MSGYEVSTLNNFFAYAAVGLCTPLAAWSIFNAFAAGSTFGLFAVGLAAAYMIWGAVDSWRGMRGYNASQATLGAVTSFGAFVGSSYYGNLQGIGIMQSLPSAGIIGNILAAPTAAYLVGRQLPYLLMSPKP